MSLLAHSRVLSLSLLAMALAACSEGPSTGQPGNAAAPATLQGGIVKGVTRNAQITAYAPDGTQLATTLSDAQGGYALVLPAGYTGAVRLTGTPSADAGFPTQMRCDASPGCGTHEAGTSLDDNGNGTVDFGEWMPVAPEFSLRAVTVATAGALQPVNLSLISTMAADWAVTFPQGLDAYGVAAANERAATVFGLTTADLEAPAGDLTDPLWRNVADPHQIEVALISAVPAQAAAMYGVTAEVAIQGVASMFVQNHGALLQQSGTRAPDLYMVLGTARALADAIDLPPNTRAQVLASIDSRLNDLTVGEYTARTEATLPYLLGKLGAVGAQLEELRVLAGVDDVNAFLTEQTPYFSWLITPENINLVPLAIETVTYALIGSVLLDAQELSGVFTFVDDGLSTITLDADTRTLHVNGIRYSQVADLDVGLTNLRGGLQAKVLDYSVSGSIENDVATGTIDGTLHVDLTQTDLTALDNALSTVLGGAPETVEGEISGDQDVLLDAVLDLAYSLNATVDVQGTALLTRKSDPDQVFGGSTTLSGWVDLGAPAGTTMATLDVSQLEVFLPNGAHLYGRPGMPVLTVTVADDATAVIDGAATGFGIPEAIGHAEGTFVNARSLFDHVRSVVTTLANSAEPTTFDAFVTQLVDFDTSQLALHGEGTVLIPELGHHYRGRIDNLTATLYQPNSEEVAATAVADVPGQGIDLLLGSESWRIQYIPLPQSVELRGPAGEFADITSTEAMSFLTTILDSIIAPTDEGNGDGTGNGGGSGGGDGNGGDNGNGGGNGNDVGYNNDGSIPAIGVTQGTVPTYVVTEGTSDVQFGFSGDLPKPVTDYTVRWYIDGAYLPAMDGLLSGAIPAELLTAGVHSIRIELTDNTAAMLTTIRLSQPIAVVPVQVTIAPDMTEFLGVSIAILMDGVDISSAPQGAENIEVSVLGYNPAPEANHKLRWYLNGVHAPEYDDQLNAQGLVNTLNPGVYVLRLEITDLNASPLKTATVSRAFAVTNGEGGGAFGLPLLVLMMVMGLLRRRRR